MSGARPLGRGAPRAQARMPEGHGGFSALQAVLRAGLGVQGGGAAGAGEAGRPGDARAACPRGAGACQSWCLRQELLTLAVGAQSAWSACSRLERSRGGDCPCFTGQRAEPPPARNGAWGMNGKGQCGESPGLESCVQELEVSPWAAGGPGGHVGVAQRVAPVAGSAELSTSSRPGGVPVS